MHYLSSALNMALVLCAGLVIGGFMWPSHKQRDGYMYYRMLCSTTEDAQKYARYRYSYLYTEPEALTRTNDEAGKISCKEYSVIGYTPRSITRTGRFSEIFKSGSIYSLEAVEVPLALLSVLSVQTDTQVKTKLYMIELDDVSRKKFTPTTTREKIYNPRSR